MRGAAEADDVTSSVEPRRHRGDAFSARLKLLTAVFATILAAASLSRFGFTGYGFFGAAFTGVLAWISVYDWATRLILNRIVIPASAFALAFRCALEPSHWLTWTTAGLIAAAALLALALVNPAGLGMGDVKLALLLGFGLGRGVVPAVLLGFLAAGAYSALLIVARGSSARKSTFAFGPFLAGAAVAVFLLS